MAFPKKKRTGIPVIDQPSPIQKAIEQPQSRAPPMKEEYTNVEFLPGGRVRRTDSQGNQREFNKEEWGLFNQDGGGLVTENVKGARAERRQEILDKGFAKPTEQEASAMQTEQDAKSMEEARLKAQQVDPGRIDFQSNIEVPNILPEIGAGALQGAALGGAAGLAGSAGTLSAPLAGVGAVVGAIRAGLPAIKGEYSEYTAEEYKTLTEGKKALTAIVNDANKKLASPEELQMRYAATLRKIDQAEANTRKLSENNWLSKAKPKLVAFETFNSGVRQSFNTRFALALTKPDPTNLMPVETTEDLLE